MRGGGGGRGGCREENGLGRMEVGGGEEGESPAEKNTAEERGIMKHLNSSQKSSARVKVGCEEFVQNNMPAFGSARKERADWFGWFILTWR